MPYDEKRGRVWGWYQARLTLRNRLSQARAYWRMGRRRRSVAYVVICASELVGQAGHEWSEGLSRLAYRIEFQEPKPRG